MNIDYSKELPLIQGRLSLGELEDLIAKPMSDKPTPKYYIALAITLTDRKSVV